MHNGANKERDKKNTVIIHTEVKQNLEGKVWDMGAYYYCKFSRDDERKAILDRDFCAKKL
ncbi:hypothetical protein M2306_002083 [Myroides gitamensis]|uniref:hypothetical protein n=1 Tax=Myroides odoratus TaxID=256 RepID=UPI00216704F0|nr:hypothetical protein [Myroides odoratus]MCS4239540.1 hypothetical protein [Myroides odoratus]MDH6601389.1 hypothetical protein [Myroides gitamensis]